MSRLVLGRILRTLAVSVSSAEMDKLLDALRRCFGLEGGYECDALERLWMDEYYRKAIEGFIMEWVKRKRRRASDERGGRLEEAAYVT
ncbi:MAG: hypothetical protein KIH01_00730 [Candidatus Freyarchaeota archaeon]|nr:hypothetical protein [Candidatus Jordarchaeia archaeon]